MHFPRIDLTCMGLTCKILPRICQGDLVTNEVENVWGLGYDKEDERERLQKDA